MPRVFCLSIHADYACRHAGACCRAGWPIPVDPSLQRRIDAARRADRLVMPRHEPSLQACVYYEPSTDPTGRRCAIHRQLGEVFKPPSCRHFPRIALLDPRGVSLTLSHFCPTAAGMLFRTDVALAVMERPPSFPPDLEYEGLDARHVLPPLLRPGMLWDLEGYSTWERLAVALFAREEMTPGHALDRLDRVGREIERWSPSEGSLARCVERAFASQEGSVVGSSPWGDRKGVVNRYLAARLFASWVPYRSDRAGALVDDIARAHAVLMEEAARPGVDLLGAIRATDLRIVHALT